jgi:hypothetical protein
VRYLRRKRVARRYLLELLMKRTRASIALEKSINPKVKKRESAGDKNNIKQ